MLSDGGQVALDWVENETSRYNVVSRPTCILLPGMIGYYLCNTYQCCQLYLQTMNLSRVIYDMNLCDIT